MTAPAGQPGDEKDPRPLLNSIDQACADIRTYSTQMWQVAAVSLAVVALGINTAVSSYYSDSTAPDWLLLAIFVLAFAFAGLGSYTIYWLRLTTLSRVEFLQEAEQKLSEMKGENYVHGFGTMLETNDAPLKALLVFFLGLASVLIFPVLYFAVLVASPVISPTNVRLAAVIIVPTIGLPTAYLLLERLIAVRHLRRRENEVFSPVDAYRLFEDEVQKKLDVFANTHGFKLQRGVRVGNYEFDFILKKPDTVLLVEVKGTTTPYVMRRGCESLILRSSAYDKLMGGQSLLVLVTPGSAVEEIQVFGRTVFHIGHDSDSEAIARWESGQPRNPQVQPT